MTLTTGGGGICNVVPWLAPSTASLLANGLSGLSSDAPDRRAAAGGQQPLLCVGAGDERRAW